MYVMTHPKWQQFDKSVKAVELIRFLFFFGLFFLIVFSQIDITESYDITQGIRKALLLARNQRGIPFEDIHNSTHVQEWIGQNLIEELIKPRLDGTQLGENDDFYVANQNKIITELRMSFQFITYNDNPSNRFDDFWPYQLDWKDREQVGPPCASFIGNWLPYNENGLDGEGSYEFIIQTRDTTAFLRSLGTMRHLALMPTHVGLLQIDFVTYNGHLNLFSYVKVRFQYEPGGTVNQSMTVETMNIDQYDTHMQRVRGVFEIIFITMIVIYYIIEIKKVKDAIYELAGKHQHMRDRIRVGLLTHFSVTVNVTTSISLLMSTAQIIAWAVFVGNEFLQGFIEDPKSFSPREVLDGFGKLSQIYEVYIVISAIGCIFIALRLTRYLTYFRKINVIYNVLRQARPLVISFLALVLGMVFAFCLYVYFNYASKSELLNTLEE